MLEVVPPDIDTDSAEDKIAPEQTLENETETTDEIDTLENSEKSEPDSTPDDFTDRDKADDTKNPENTFENATDGPADFDACATEIAEELTSP